MFFCLGTFCRIWPLTQVLCVHCVLRIRLGWFLVGQSVFILCVVVFRLQPSCQHTFEACTCNTRTALYLQCLWTEASLTSSDQVGVRLAHHWLRRLDAFISRFIQDGVLRRDGARLDCAAGSADKKRKSATFTRFCAHFRLWFGCSAICIRSVCVWSGQGEMSFFVYRLLINTSECPERNIVDSTFWNSGGELRRPLRDGHV